MLRKYALTVVFLGSSCAELRPSSPTTNTIPMARVMSSVRPSCLPTPRFSTGQSRPCPTSTAAFRPSICPTSRSAAAGSITPRRRPPFPGWGFRPAISVRCGCSGLGKSAVPGSRHCRGHRRCWWRTHLLLRRSARGTFVPRLRQFHRPQLPGRGETRLCAACGPRLGCRCRRRGPHGARPCTSKASSRMP